MLAIALARSRPDIRVIAVDISGRALRCAAQNIRELGLEGRIELRLSNWFSEIREGAFHLIVSNPPYVPSGEIGGLEPEVSTFEPRRALDGGPDGLRAIREILSEAPRHLAPGGWILLEIGDGQGRDALRFARRVSHRLELRVERDLGGRERFLIGRCSRATT